MKKNNPSDHDHSSWALLLVVIIMGAVLFAIVDQVDRIEDRLDAMSQTEQAR